MIIMDLKLDNLCCFRDFHVNFSYPRKVENEYLEGFPNFRYKKINIIMGSNATGKTSLGRVILSIFNFVDKRNADIITRFISNNNKTAFFIMDFVDDNKLYRIHAVFDPSDDHIYASENIKIHIVSTDICLRDNYESCAKRLDSMMVGLNESNYIMELEKLRSLPIDSIFNYGIKANREYINVLKHTLRVLDPNILSVNRIEELKNAFVIKIADKSIIIQDGKMINDSLLSSGTKAGLDIASIVSSIKLGTHSLYYCDEKFSYVYSDIEIGFLSLMINELKPNSQLFYTTHNLDILDLPLPKHSFNFLKKDDQCISVINAADYLKKNTDSLRNAVDNDFFSVTPRLDEIENL